MSWWDVRWDGFYFLRADHDITVNNDGAMFGSETWSEHQLLNCASDQVANGHTTFNGALIQ